MICKMRLRDFRFRPGLVGSYNASLFFILFLKPRFFLQVLILLAIYINVLKAKPVPQRQRDGGDIICLGI